MTYNPEPEIQRYLKRLTKAARDLPRGRRRELVAEIEQHIREALIEAPVDNEAEMLTVLDRLGDPDEIAASERGKSEFTRSTAMETWAIILLLIGGFLWFVGWIAGVVLLWSSSLWTTRDKLIGTLVVPGGLAAGVAAYFFAGHLAGHAVCSSINGSPSRCTGGSSTLEQVFIAVVASFVLLGPIWTSIYLGRRLNKEKQALAAAT